MAFMGKIISMVVKKPALITVVLAARWCSWKGTFFFCGADAALRGMAPPAS